ncbi:hypothetical protein BJX70DRAFT_185195 [Aspergillus crustosus]
MDDHHYHHYPGFHAYHLDHHSPIVDEVQLYHHDANAMVTTMPDAMMGCLPMACETNAAVKHAPFPSFGPSSYPHPPSVAEMGYWNPPSPFEESVRSNSPHTDSQSSGCFSAHYDDSVSCSNFASSPSPSYPEMPVAMYTPESLPSEPVQPIAQANCMFIQVYANHPTEYTTPASSPTEPSKPPRKAPTRKATRNRVQKRSKPVKKSPTKSRRTKAETTTKPAQKKATDRRFECCFARYGCTSTFPSKNEWKRHVSSQHIQPGFYRCDIGRCSLNNLKRDPSQSHSHSDSRSSSSSSSPTSSNNTPTTPTTPTILINDFNRKDLFIQHQRRMHAPWVSSKTRKASPTQTEKDAFEASLAAASERCWTELRRPPTRSRCGFCAQEFRGEDAWKERMEHVARHLEKADPGPEVEDVPLREWAVENGVLRFERERGGWWLVGLCGK